MTPVEYVANNFTCADVSYVHDCAMWLCSDAVNGLQHIHAHSVLHMDIKPENMYLDSSGVFKLGDFGIAINIANQSGWEEGDGRYAAPELLQRFRPTGAADIYSLGATMLHCSIGKQCSHLNPIFSARSTEFHISLCFSCLHLSVILSMSEI